jgi:hypothetical protein
MLHVNALSRGSKEELTRPWAQPPADQAGMAVDEARCHEAPVAPNLPVARENRMVGVRADAANELVLDDHRDV